MSDVIDEVLSFLYMDAVDPREFRDLVSKMGDSSEVHVNTPLKSSPKKVKQELKRSEKIKRKGDKIKNRSSGPAKFVKPFISDELSPSEKLAYATNAEGMIAGPAATGMAAAAMVRNDGGLPRMALKRIAGGKAKLKSDLKISPDGKTRTTTTTETRKNPTKGWRKKAMNAADWFDNQGKHTKSKPAKVGALVAGGTMVGLQGVNWVGDSVATRMIHEKSTQNKNVQKSFDDIIELRRAGSITTDEALELIDKRFERITSAAQAVANKLPRKRQTVTIPKSTMDQINADYADDAIKTGQNYWIAGGAGAAALGLGAVGATKYNQHRQAKKQAVPQMAPQREFRKSDEHELTWGGEISKTDTDKKQVFGWCSITHVDGQPVIDRQGDYIPLEEVEKSAYDYVIHSRKGGNMHKRDGDEPLHASDMIESFVVTPDKLEQLGLERDAIPHGWWVGFKVNDDELWDEVKKGDKVHFSIHGRGRRVDRDEDEILLSKSINTFPLLKEVDLEAYV